MTKKQCTFPLFLVLVLFFTACSGDPATNSEGDDAVVILGESSDSSVGLEGVSELQIVIPANDLGVGTPRIPFIIMDGGQMVNDVEAAFLTVFDLSQDPPAVAWEGAATNYSDYKVPYWVFYPTVETVGNYGVRADLLQSNGNSTQAQFAVAIQEDAIAPNVGDPGFPSVSRTGTGDALKEISSDQTPDESLYQITLEEALGNGRATVISFSTPAYCQTAICAPVLESVKNVKDARDGDIDFVHVEIFGDFETFEPAEAVTEWQLQSEPWTYVLDDAGIVTARFAGPVSPSELQAALAKLE